MRRNPRLEWVERRYPRPRALDVGGGKSILTTPDDRFDMLVAAISREDHPLLEAVRSAEGSGPVGDNFAILLRAIEGRDDSLLPPDYVPPSEATEEPEPKKPPPTFRELAEERFRKWKEKRDRELEELQKEVGWFFDARDPENRG